MTPKAVTFISTITPQPKPQIHTPAQCPVFCSRPSKNSPFWSSQYLALQLPSSSFRLPDHLRTVSLRPAVPEPAQQPKAPIPNFLARNGCANSAQHSAQNPDRDSGSCCKWGCSEHLSALELVMWSRCGRDQHM